MVTNHKQGRSTSIVVWGTALVLVLLGFYAVHSVMRQRVAVHTANVSYLNVVKTSSANGKVELTDDFQPRAQAPAQVKEIYVDSLERVHQGQLLLKLDDSAALANLAHAQASLRAAEAGAANVSHGGSQEERNSTAADLSHAQLQQRQDENTLAATQKLAAQGAASPAELAAAEHRVQVDKDSVQSLQNRSSRRYAAADVTSAESQVTDARAAVAAAQSALSNDLIKSPLNGTVYYLPVTQYDYVSAGEELLDVADLTKMRITAYFDEPDIGTLAVGQNVSITWEAKPGHTWHGHIEQIPSTIIQYQNRFVGECLITVDDADGILAPNANVNLKVTIAQHPHVLAVPREALHFDHSQPYVFRIISGKLVRTNVKIDLVNLTAVEIVSGLTEGETVALNATTNAELSNGQAVTAIP